MKLYVCLECGALFTGRLGRRIPVSCSLDCRKSRRSQNYKKYRVANRERLVEYKREYRQKTGKTYYYRDRVVAWQKTNRDRVNNVRRRRRRRIKREFRNETVVRALTSINKDAQQ